MMIIKAAITSFSLRRPHSILTANLIVKRLGLGPGTWDLGPGTWDLGPGTWDLGPWTWDLGIESRIENRESRSETTPSPRR